MDGTTDAGNKEDELIVPLYCSKDASAQEITSNSRYLSIHNPGKADASGLLSCVNEAMKFMGVDNVLDKDSVLGVEGRPVFIGGGTDGASVTYWIEGSNTTGFAMALLVMVLRSPFGISLSECIL